MWTTCGSCHCIDIVIRVIFRQSGYSVSLEVEMKRSQIDNGILKRNLLDKLCIYKVMINTSCYFFKCQKLLNHIHVYLFLWLKLYEIIKPWIRFQRILEILGYIQPNGCIYKLLLILPLSFFQNGSKHIMRCILDFSVRKHSFLSLCFNFK